MKGEVRECRISFFRLRMTKNKFKIFPSILAADFAYIADEVKKAEEAEIDGIHIDIMDGLFVPNLTMGPRMCSAIRRHTSLYLDVHLMIYNPFDWIERFVEAGANRITFHLEATEDVEETLDYIHRCNIDAGLAFNPETSASLIPKYLDKCDNILLMTVPPGFGGQSFDQSVLEKIVFTRAAIEKRGVMIKGKNLGDPDRPLPIEVDGGIDPETAKACREAGATEFVAGTSLYGAPDFKNAVNALRTAINE